MFRNAALDERTEMPVGWSKKKNVYRRVDLSAHAAITLGAFGGRKGPAFFALGPSRDQTAYDL